MDAAAREMKIDGSALRRRNMIRPEQMPYTNPWRRCTTAAASSRSSTRACSSPTGTATRRARPRAEARGRLRGRGIATFLEWTGGNVFEERVTVDVTPTASSRSARPRRPWARASPPAMRSWRSTSSACRPSACASCRATPTGSTASAAPAAGRCSPAARSVRVAAQRTVDKGKALAAEALEAPVADIEYREGRFSRGRHRPRHRPGRAGRPPGRAAHVRRQHLHRRRPHLAQRLPRLRGRDRPRHRRGRDRGLCLGQRHRPRRQPGHRARPDRRRRGAGHRPGAVRAHRLRPRHRPAAERQLHGLCAAACRWLPRLQDPSTPASPA
jgi:CO/xanthine dehydrogenase Mo-binding subunit